MVITEEKIWCILGGKKLQVKPLPMTFDHAANKSFILDSSCYRASFVYEQRRFFKN